jgi:hypothetical protein
MIHWLWTQVVIPIWPNLAASPIVGSCVAVSHVLRERAAERRHQAAEEAAAARHTELLGRVTP